MNLQRLYDDVSRHLLTQNASARGADNGCRYRTDAGLKCAVGAIIPDHLYNSDMESWAPEHFLVLDKYAALRTHLVKRYAVTRAEMHAFLNHLSELQHIHDSNRPERWPELLATFAARHNLTPPGGTRP